MSYSQSQGERTITWHGFSMEVDADGEGYCLVDELTIEVDPDDECAIESATDWLERYAPEHTGGVDDLPIALRERIKAAAEKDDLYPDWLDAKE